jgi:hypothetical protein
MRRGIRTRPTTRRKVPAWVASVVREVMPCRVVQLVRDPGDVIVSAREFARPEAAVGFWMESSSAEMAGPAHRARAARIH